MQKGVSRREFDDAGLPNLPTGERAKANPLTCPVCSASPPVRGTGTTWKWFAFHFAHHLGYEPNVK